jgi:hypothetical protein
MKYIICPNCGNKNLAEHSACLRCKTELEPALYIYHDTSSTFDRLLLRKSVTLSSPLTITEARQHLQALLATDLVISDSGLLGTMNARSYQGTFDGSTLQMHGPFGYRKQKLLTEGHLQEDGNGVSLKLMLSPKNSAVELILLGVFICLPMILTRSLCMLPASLFFVVFFYVGFLIHFLTEAGEIEDLLGSILFKRDKKAHQEEVMPIS